MHAIRRTAGRKCLVTGWMLGVLQLGQGVPGLRILDLAGFLEVLALVLRVDGKTVQWE